MSIISMLQATEAVITSHTNYSASNVSIGDWSILTTGLSRAVILEYEPSSHGPGNTPVAGHGRFASNHIITIGVYHRMDSNSTYENLLSDVDDVIAQLNAYPHLNGAAGVRRAVITGSSGIELRVDEPYYMRLDLRLEVVEEVNT